MIRDKRWKYQGFTLTEVAIVLGLVAIVLGGIWAAAGRVWDDSRGNQLQQQIMTVVQNMREYFSPMGQFLSCAADYTAFIDDDDRRLIPIDMRSQPALEGQAINHVLGAQTGNATAGSFRVSCLSATTFRILVRDLDPAQCIKLLRTFPVLTPSVGVIRMAGPGGNAAIDARNIENPSSISLPLDLSVAETWCSSATDNEVSFDFTLLN
ncbi:MAG: type II secretion system protein [Bdellovibrionales bacterium]